MAPLALACQHVDIVSSGIPPPPNMTCLFVCLFVLARRRPCPSSSLETYNQLLNRQLAKSQLSGQIKRNCVTAKHTPPHPPHSQPPHPTPSSASVAADAARLPDAASGAAEGANRMNPLPVAAVALGYGRDLFTEWGGVLVSQGGDRDGEEFSERPTKYTGRRVGPNRG